MNKSVWHYIFFVVIGLILMIITGCMTFPKPSSPTIQPKEDNLQVDTPALPFYAQMQREEGSLWSDSAMMLFIDQKAHRVGDTITIDIVENTSSKMNVNTASSKETNLSAGVPSLFGFMRALETKNPNLNKAQGGTNFANNMLETAFKNELTGAGSSDRSGQVTASIGARVVEVLPNGNLVLYGKREMKVNSETQKIEISGVVRLQDITQDNRIKSTYLADARIEYSGKGVLADKQNPGWMARVLDNVWPF